MGWIIFAVITATGIFTTWKAQREHAEDMIEELHKRIDEFTEVVEAESVAS